MLCEFWNELFCYGTFQWHWEHQKLPLVPFDVLETFSSRHVESPPWSCSHLLPTGDSPAACHSLALRHRVNLGWEMFESWISCTWNLRWQSRHTPLCLYTWLFLIHRMQLIDDVFIPAVIMGKCICEREKSTSCSLTHSLLKKMSDFFFFVYRWKL